MKLSSHKILFPAAAGLLSGILLFKQLPISLFMPVVSALAVAMFASILLILKQRCLFTCFAMVFVAAVCVGAFRFSTQANNWKDEVSRFDSGTVQLSIVTQPQLITTGRTPVVRFLARPSGGYKGLARVSWYRPAAVLPALGEQWQFELRSRPPDGFDNRGVSRYSEWLAQQNIIALAYASGADAGQSQSGSASKAPVNIAAKIEVVLQHWLAGKPSLAVVRTLVTGVKEAYSDDLTQTIRRSGISHLLAISGLHIGLVAGLGFLLGKLITQLLGRLRKQRLAWPTARWVEALFGLLAAFSYAALSGFAVPAQRALLMLLLFWAGLLVMRKPLVLPLLLWAAVVVVLVDPFAPLSAGFWLSFVAVLAIVVSLRGHRRNAPAIEDGLAAQARWLLKLKRSAILLLRIQLTLSLCLMPLSLLYFSEVSLVSPLANLIAVPVFSLLVVPLALVGVLLGLLWLPLAWPLLLAEWFATAILMLCEQLLALADALGGAVWVAGQPSKIALVVMLLGCFLLIGPRGLGIKPLALLLLGCGLLLPNGMQQRPLHSEARITILDVGHGLAVHVQTAEHDLLYDTGAKFSSGSSVAEIVLSPYLKGQKISSLNALVVSHSDNDHSGGIAHIDKAFTVERKLGWGGEACVAGNNWNWDGVLFEVLWPSGASAHETNNQSCVLLVSIADVRFLITGDIERAAEQSLLEVLPKVAGLTVPHHGSETSSHAAFVATLEPQWGIISSARNGRFKLPRDSVVQRYQTLGTEVLTTAESGSITLLLSESALKVEGQSRQSRAWWLADLD